MTTHSYGFSFRFLSERPFAFSLELTLMFPQNRTELLASAAISARNRQDSLDESEGHLKLTVDSDFTALKSETQSISFPSVVSADTGPQTLRASDYPEMSEVVDDCRQLTELASGAGMPAGNQGIPHREWTRP